MKKKKCDRNCPYVQNKYRHLYGKNCVGFISFVSTKINCIPFIYMFARYVTFTKYISVKFELMIRCT